MFLLPLTTYPTRATLKRKWWLLAPQERAFRLVPFPAAQSLLFKGTVAGVSRTVSNCISCCDLPMMSGRSTGPAEIELARQQSHCPQMGPLEESIRF